MALWTLVDQQKIKPIDAKNEGRFRQLQREVELNDLQQYLGYEFYQELLRNTDNYTVLLNSGTFTESGVLYHFDGLKTVFAYLLYARYVAVSDIVDTYSGMVRHSGQDFQRIGQNEIKNLQTDYRNVAGAAWEECRRYLCSINNPYFIQNKRKKIDVL